MSKPRAEPAQTIPWGLLARLGEGAITPEEVDVLTPMLLAEPVEPPNWFITRAAALPRLQRMQPSRPSLLTRLVASLTFDSALQPGLAGVRGSADGVRRLVYETDRLIVQMEISDDEGGCATVADQVATNEPGSQVVIELAGDSEEMGSTTTSSNEFGYFSMQRVHRGTYRLIIHGEEEEIEVRAVPV